MPYDVFLSYSWRDAELVESLARWLKANQVTPFLDRWYLAPGQSWPQALETRLADCGAVAVCIGPGELGAWQQREVNLALQRQGRDPAFPVIPVLLPGADPVLGFLSQNTWVDLRADPNDEVRLRTLANAARGQPPGDDLREQVAALRAAICPFRGLRYFREEDAPFFFGRNEAIGNLAEAVDKRKLVALVGASGAGKSSVVRAGLVPRLRKGLGNGVWDVVTVVPGDRPLHQLAAALVPLLEPAMTETDRLSEVGKLAGLLADRFSNVTLKDVVLRALGKQPGTDRLLLVIDQFEELYSLTSDVSWRDRFFEELLDVTHEGPVQAVLTLRDDFYGRAVLKSGQLSERLQGGVVNLLPMREEETRAAIVRPAYAVGLKFDPGLVDLMLKDVQDQPGGLPLLEFVLEQLWHARQGANLLLDSYRSIGGLQGALAKHAEGVLARFSDVEREAARRIFLLLVRPGTGTDDTRRRAAMSEISELERPLVRQLADNRLIVTARDDAGAGETVEVAHEALIRNWPELREWVNGDREFLLWRERLQSALTQWQRTNQDDGSLLRGAALTEAEHWLETNGVNIAPDLREYIARSVKLRKHEKRRRRRFALFFSIAIALPFLGAIGLAWNQIVGYYALVHARNAIRELQTTIADPNTPPQEREKLVYTLISYGERNLASASLQNLNLRGLQMYAVQFTNADLTGALFDRAGLGNSDFSGATLVAASLSGAMLHGAQLRGANLRDANLRGANLSNTNLTGANFSMADLREVDLDGAIVDNAIFLDALFDATEWWRAAGWSTAQLRDLDNRYPPEEFVRTEKYKSAIRQLDHSVLLAQYGAIEKGKFLNERAWYRALLWTELDLAHADAQLAFDLLSPAAPDNALDTLGYILM